jgi:hypothetical protein
MVRPGRYAWSLLAYMVSNAGAKKLTVDKDFLRKKDRSATGTNPTVIGTDDGDGNTVPF